MNVEEEVEKLKEEIKRLGKVQDDGSYKVHFSTHTANWFSLSRLTNFMLFFLFWVLSKLTVHGCNHHHSLKIFDRISNGCRRVAHLGH